MPVRTSLAQTSAALVLGLVASACTTSNAANGFTFPPDVAADAASGADVSGADAAGAADNGAPPADAQQPPADTAQTADAAGGPFQTAPHPPLPVVVDQGGTILAAPKVEPMGYADDPLAADVGTFLGQLSGSGYWQDIAGEYGVGSLAVLPWRTLAASTPAKVSESTLLGQLSDALAATGPDPNTIYLFVIPASATLTRSGSSAGGCCVDFDGYHSETDIAGVTVPYAIVCECPDETAPGLDLASQLMSSIAHELVEAATDPFPDSDTPAYIATGSADAAWTAVTGGEVADMCENNADVLVQPSGFTYLVPRSWSNVAALAGKDPCVPAPLDGPYFNAAPVLTDTLAITDEYGTKWQAKGVKILVGAQKTIDVVLYSMGPTQGPWQVDALDVSEFNGGTPRLAFSWDTQQGSNGDTLHLTITVKSKDKAVGGELFMIQSTLGARTSLTMGAVGG